MSKMRHLTMIDWTTIASNFSAIQTFINNTADVLSSLVSVDASISSRVTAIESISGLGGLSTRVSACEAVDTAHNGRITATEANIVAHNARIASVETWRANKAPASANVSTNWTIPTAVITLGLNAPTAAGLKSIVDTIMGEVNGLKQIMRDREILAT